jgi:hypothetical protein
MNYRPQFAYPPAPQGFEDRNYTYTFHPGNVPQLGVTMPALSVIENIALPLEPDADFLCRAIQINLFCDYAYLRTPRGDNLSDGYAPLWLWPPASSVAWPGSGNLAMPFEPEIVCPAGSFWLLFLQNRRAIPVVPTALTQISLFGVKRREVRP